MRYLIIHRPGGMMGGDVIAAHDYVAALQVHGAEVGIRPADNLGDVRDFDWVHIWSANAPQWGLPVAREVKRQGTRLTITPNWWSRKKRLDHYGYHEQDVVPGYTASVAQVLSMADVLFVCTMSEAVECWKLAPYKTAFVFQHGCNMPGVEAQEPEDYVLCLARLEQHKNQVNLAMACKHLGYRLILFGAVADESVKHQAVALGAEYAGMGDHHQAMDLLSRARVHALPSFSETPGLSNMEAALLEVPAVMGNIGAEPEFFGYAGIYADPTDWRHIAAGVDIAWRRGRGQWAHVPPWEVVAMRALEYLEARA
jgi:glycosyltransferase involved in cell wall biosynthesis